MATLKGVGDVDDTMRHRGLLLALITACGGGDPEPDEGKKTIDVVLTRRDGVKLAPVVMRGAAPSRGRQVIVTIPWREEWAPHKPRVDATFARLLTVPPPKTADERLNILPELRDARFRSWDGEQGVIVGVESLGNANIVKDYPQAWWCRVVVR